MLYSLNFTADGYIESIQRGGVGHQEISAEKYDVIRAIINDKPEPPEGYDYRLKTDFTWELCEIPEPEHDPDPEISDSEALNIITGGVDA